MIVVEVLGRRGEVLQRTRIEHFPAAIGRAWTNDIVIADPTVDAHHARIILDETGAPRLEDLGSLNGVHVGNQRGRATAVALTGLLLVRLGRAQLRIGGLDAPVPPAVPELAPSGRIAWLLDTPAAIAGVTVLGIGLIALLSWLGSYESGAAAAVTNETVGFVAVVAAWATVWSLIGRLNVHQLRFWQHNALSWLGVVLLIGLATLSSWLGYLWPGSGALSLLGFAAGVAILVSLIAAHLGLVSAMARRRRVALGLVATAAIAGLAALTTQAARNEFSSGNTVAIDASLKPWPGPVPATSVDVFLGQTNGLKQAIDRAARE